MLVVASSEVYGLIEPEDLPVDEATPLRPNSPYGISKVAQDLMAQQYWFNFGMPTVRVRSFNHIGPGQSDSFVASAFARQIAEIEAGRQEPILRVGNLGGRTRLHRRERHGSRVLACPTAWSAWRRLQRRQRSVALCTGAIGWPTETERQRSQSRTGPSALAA